MNQPPARPPGMGKLRDRAFILPLVGFALLMPPLASIFQLDSKIAGVPFTLIYVFAVWAGLILACWRLSRRLGREQWPEEAARGGRGSGEGAT